MIKNPDHHFIRTAFLLLCSSLLYSEGVMSEANRDLLAASATTRSLLVEIKQKCPGFTITFVSDSSLPRASQLRTLDAGSYIGAINLRHMDLKIDAPETAIAGFYLLIHQELVAHHTVTMGRWIEFQNKVRTDLRKADPARYGHLRKLDSNSGISLGR